MPRSRWFTVASLAIALGVVALSGCSRPSAVASVPATANPPQPAMELVQPERATLRRSIEQPSSIQAFEQAPIYSKIAGYVRKWNVDLGDRVKAGDILAELAVPELVEELKQKKALVVLAQKNHAAAEARVALVDVEADGLA